ncbi:MAG: hypothetical protein BWK75_02460 [Candidatus Altiarchaeales archaeon A3]|nr:MAG: hypothetical protein BWK75_02460 [Candidatus Altiarchaeales archaeon A3]
MICNELYDGQGLGNQLWNYVLTRIISKQKGCAFSILEREKFKGSQFIDIDFGVKLLGGISPEGGPPYKLPQGIKNYYRERIENLLNTDIDISRTDPNLFQIPPNTKFDGNCQSIKYLNGYRNNILDWIKIKDEYKGYTTDDNTCIIHLRCGDFVGIKEVFLPPNYYKQAMEFIKKINNNIKFYCVTDQKNIAKDILPDVEIIGSSILNEDDDNKASHHYGGPISTDFSLLMNAKYLIISNSSFSWWAAYLNTNKTTVIAPKYWARYNTSNGYWSTSDIITDDFTYLDRHGKFFSADECWLEKNNFELLNENIFNTVNEKIPEIPNLNKIILLLIKKNIPLPIKIMVTKFTNKAKILLKKIISLQKAKLSFNDVTEYKQLSAEEIAEYRKTIKIYDIFIFFNELELLEIRLNILDKYVDYFVIVEATQTFSGLPKKLFFEENKRKFKQFEHKIIYYVINNMPADEDELRSRLLNNNLSALDREIINNTLTSDNVPNEQSQWLREFYQKETIKKALVELSDNDICFVSDLDEIWNPQVKIDYTKNNIFKLKQNVYVYFLNNRSSESWIGTYVTKYKNIKNNCINHLDTPSKTKYTILKNGGWHFTFQGGAEAVIKKIESYGHQEFNNDKIKSHLENKILENKDFIERNFKFWIDEKNLPEYILNNKDKYKKFFK